MFGELMDNIKLEVLSNLFRSTTNLQAFETCCGVFRNTSSKPMFQGSADRKRSRHPAAAKDGEPEAPKIELPIRRELPR